MAEEIFDLSSPCKVDYNPTAFSGSLHDTG
jgi:hypothetical protein